MHRKKNFPQLALPWAMLAALPLLVACQSGLPTPPPPAGHLLQAEKTQGASASALAPSPATVPGKAESLLGQAMPPAKAPRYTVQVRGVPAGEILLALAQEEKLDLDIAPGIDPQTPATLSARQKTAAEIFARLAFLLNARIEEHGGLLRLMPDAPFVRQYRVDYPNLSRSMRGTVAASTQIAAAERYGDGQAQPDGDNVSSSRVESTGQNDFWGSLERNLRDLIREPGQSAEEAAANVIVHAESGILGVRATAARHRQVADWLLQAASAAKRQVLIEATIVEVELSEAWRQGIEWSRVWDGGGKSLSVSPAPMRNSDGSLPQPFVLSFKNLANPLSATIELLSAFGTTKVLSSPRLAVLNNQTALLKVVENVVYFSIKAEVAAGNSNSNPLVAYTSTPQTVSVGLAMAVTPQIDAQGGVVLNVRPTLSSIAGMVKDPNPDIPAHVANEIPQIRTREIESVLRLGSGQTGMLGGLMEDRFSKAESQVPLLGKLPLVGALFSGRNDAYKKSELVIFLRPVVLPEPGAFPLDGLPGPEFWQGGRAPPEA
jgi:general secretion pathway protein D